MDIENITLCPERTIYKKFINEPKNQEDDNFFKKKKALEEQYKLAFHNYVAEVYPYLKYEKTNDKVYWNYDEKEGVYKELSFAEVRSFVIKLLIDEGLLRVATESEAKSVLNKLRASFPEWAVTQDDFVTTGSWLHVNNGWLNLDTLELFPHTHEKLSLYKMSVDYNPEAVCPLYDKFLDEDLQMKKDAVRVIDQFSGYMLTDSIEEQVMLVFEGRPGCGKSTIPRIWLKMLGKKGTTASLTSLGQGEARFMGDVFAHRNFCFFDEANPKTQNINEYFMNMVDKDDIKIERKGIQGHSDVRNTLKMVLALNEMPDHQPEGFGRRYRHLLFTRSFTDEGVADRGFQQKIVDNELSGVLNRMLKALIDYKKMGGLTSIEGELERKRNHTLAADDISAFVEEHFMPVNDGVVRYNYQQMRSAFVNEFPKSYNKQLSVQSFNKKLMSVRLPEFKHITTGRNYNGRGYVGLKLKKGHSFGEMYEQIRIENEVVDWW